MTTKNGKLFLRYESCDGYSEEAAFTTQADAVAFLAYWLCDSRGNFDDAGWYAVSADGVGRVVGAYWTKLEDLWANRGHKPPEVSHMQHGDYWDDEFDLALAEFDREQTT